MKKNNSVLTRIISILLCGLIIFTTGPSTAIANDIFSPPGQTQEPAEEQEESVNETQQETITAEDEVSQELEDEPSTKANEELSDKEDAETHEKGEIFNIEEDSPATEETTEADTEILYEEASEEEVAPAEANEEAPVATEDAAEEAEVAEEVAEAAETVEAEEVAAPAEAKAEEDAEPEAEATDEPKAEEVEEPEAEAVAEPEETEYPAATLKAYAGDILVTLVAPEGSLPKGAQLRVEQVGQEYIDAVAETLEDRGRTLTDAVAIDVTPVDAEGNEIQPKKLVAVTFSGTELDLDSKDSINVFRVSDDASTITEMTAGGNSERQTFLTNHFTIFISTGSASDPNGDGSGPNTRNNPYVLEYGKRIQLRDDDSSSGNTWRIADQSTVVTLSNGGSTTVNVTNNNSGSAAVIVRITHGRNADREYFVKAMPQVVNHNVTFMLKDAGASSFVQDGDVKTVNHEESVTPPSHDAEKTGAGIPCRTAYSAFV